VEPASVGIILDSSIIIAAERKGRTVLQILEQVRAAQGELEIGVSVVSIAELVHGTSATSSECLALRSCNSSHSRERIRFRASSLEVQSGYQCSAGLKKNCVSLRSAQMHFL
jgi:predicted nucleic acid-binding protein